MTPEQFAQTYLANEANLRNILKSQCIYDEDLFQDTCLALFEYAQKSEIRHFLNTFVSFYRTRYLRRCEHESPYETCDNEQILAYDLADESDLDYREQTGKLVDAIIDDYCAHPQPRERNHERAAQILKFYRDGLSFRQIAHATNLDVAVVHRYLERTIAKLKGQHRRAII